MSANDAERKSLILFDPKARTESYKRSAHNDFAFDSELKQKQFTGWRSISLTGDAELWILGEKVRTVTKLQQKLDPMAIEKAHAEFFGFGGGSDDGLVNDAFRVKR